MYHRMGSSQSSQLSQSSPFGQSIQMPETLTHDILFKATHTTRTIMDKIFEYMLKEVTVRDFLALSNPKECNKYVLFKANMLNNMFYELQLEPTKDNKGVLAFRSIKDLVHPPTEKELIHKQSLCLTLSYFYTRIFQIYGALALTLIDDIDVMTSSGIPAYMRQEQSSSLVTPGYDPRAKRDNIEKMRQEQFRQEQVYQGQEQVRQEQVRQEQVRQEQVRQKSISQQSPTPTTNRGMQTNAQVAAPVAPVAPVATAATAATVAVKPAATVTAPVFPKLTPAALAKAAAQEGGNLPTSITLNDFDFIRTFLIGQTGSDGYKTNFKMGGVVYFKLIESNTTEASRARLTIEYTGAKSKCYLTMKASRILGTENTKLTFEKLQYYKKYTNQITTIDLPPAIFYDKTYTVTYDTEGFKIKNNYITNFFQDICRKVIDLIKQLVENGPMGNVNSYGRPITTTSSTSEVDTEEKLRLSAIIQNLKRVKPLGHCIARALQLLKTMPLPGNDGESLVCKTRFLEGSDLQEKRSGIPLPGDTLDSSPGLSALSLLFYDTIRIGTPKLSIGENKVHGGKSSLDQYVIFMQQMARLFGDRKDESGEKDRPSEYYRERDQKANRKGLKLIQNKRDKTLCTNLENKPIPVNKTNTQKIYAIVNTLFKTQYTHANKCGNILKQLFNITRVPQSDQLIITLSQNIIAKGFPEIERINYLAREVLIEYYTTCEGTYIEGMQHVINDYTVAIRANFDAKMKAKNDAKKKAENDAKKAPPTQPLIRSLTTPVPPTGAPTRPTTGAPPAGFKPLALNPATAPTAPTAATAPTAPTRVTFPTNPLKP